jgi:hypothetical protein
VPLNTRDLAAETLLLIVSATLLLMGSAGLLVGLVLPETPVSYTHLTLPTTPYV